MIRYFDNAAKRWLAVSSSASLQSLPVVASWPLLSCGVLRCRSLPKL